MTIITLTWHCTLEIGPWNEAFMSSKFYSAIWILTTLVSSTVFDVSYFMYSSFVQNGFMVLRALATIIKLLVRKSFEFDLRSGIFLSSTLATACKYHIIVC
jgi:hypothetical protein